MQQSTTCCVATKCSKHSRTAPDLNLHLQRAFRGWLLQEEGTNSGRLLSADSFCEGVSEGGREEIFFLPLFAILY